MATHSETDAQSESDEALLARIVGLRAARDLVERGSRLWDLGKRGSGLASLAGLKRAQQERLAAAFELARRRLEREALTGERLSDPASVVRHFQPLIGDEPVEVFAVAHLDARHAVLATERVSHGTLAQSLVHPREVFHGAIIARAAAIVVAHNHPSSDPEPSAEDLAVTRRLAQAGSLIGITLLDHVVLGSGRHVSLRERDEGFFWGGRESA